ncbi:hypothetical protein LLS1_38680 [Leifsonia sp. LS1]|jgi:hypothetical protein|uniref:hypothetical protein n=1 Tax=Leifsonia sp. LS1 TaxID=2828483 RepID=UPI001CFEDCC6|nr:hypothetical protein [Leifsonia sp. LS1]GIT82199.1 hypothetical protein LLS1_38680 [Leifsonia sp. LS1]
MLNRIPVSIRYLTMRQLRARVTADAVGAAAQKHIHNDLTRMHVKVVAFGKATPLVQQRVFAELEFRAEQAAPGSSSTARATFLTVLATTVTVFAAIFAALTGGFYTAAAPLQDSTGHLHIAGAAEAMHSINELMFYLFVVAAAVSTCAGLAWGLAMRRDHKRALHRTWARVFRESVASPN